MHTIDPRHPLFAAGALGLVATLGFSACQKVPYTGRQQAVAMSASAEAQLGADAYTEIMSTESIVTSGPLYEQVRTIASGISRKTPAPYNGLDWEFKLVNSEQVNAFALPGGKVGVYTGILPVLANQAGLGSVLGHEAGHVVARHSAERITGVMMLELGLAAADVGLSNTQLHDQLMGLLGIGATVGVVLPFSRANELEADYLGGILMAKQGLDPRESWAVWERMTELNGDSPIAIFSTHPSNGKRIERLQEELPTFERYYKMAKTKLGKGEALRLDLIPSAPATKQSGDSGTKSEDSGKGKGESEAAKEPTPEPEAPAKEPTPEPEPASGKSKGKGK